MTGDLATMTDTTRIAGLRAAIHLFAEALAVTPADAPSRSPRRTKREVFISAIEGAGDLLQMLQAVESQRVPSSAEWFGFPRALRPE